MFQHMLSYIRHKNKSKPCQKIITCNHCGKLIQENKFERHRSGNVCKKKFDLKCKLCLDVFSSRGAAIWHYKKLEKDPQICRKRVVCQKCESKMSEKDLTKHRCFSVPADLKCKDCLNTFANKRSMTLHLEKADTSCRKRIKCGKCGVKVREKVFDRHILSDCVAVACERCGEKFKRKQLKIHKERKKQCKSINSKCEFCDAIISDDDGYQKHMQDIHNIFNMKFEQK